MANFNRSILAGNLVGDPEVKFLESGTSVCKFTLAINSKYKKGEEWKEEVSFFDIVAFGKLGELIAENVGKGQSVLIEGRLKQERWEKEGAKKSAVRVYADSVQFLSPKKETAKAAPPADDEVPF